MKATEKQIRYAMALMAQRGYSTAWMTSAHKALGASSRQRSGRVSDWLANMTVAEAAALIDQLRAA